MSILNVLNFSEDIGTKYLIKMLLSKNLKMRTGEVFADRAENTPLNRWMKKKKRYGRLIITFPGNR